MVEAVVVRRARVLDPPVAADDAVVAVAHAGVRRHAVHHGAEAEHAGGRRAVTLVPVGRDASSAEPRAPRPGCVRPASVDRDAPDVDVGAGDLAVQRDDGHELLRARGRAEASSERHPCRARQRGASLERSRGEAESPDTASSARGNRFHAKQAARGSPRPLALRVGVVLDVLPVAPASSRLVRWSSSRSRRRGAAGRGTAASRSVSAQSGEKTWRFTFGRSP